MLLLIQKRFCDVKLWLCEWIILKQIADVF